MSVDPNNLTDSKTTTLVAPKKSITDRLWDVVAEEDKNHHWELKWSTYLGFGIFVGILLLLIYSKYSQPSRGHILAVCLLSAGAALAMGLLVGFVFGVPKVAQTSTPLPKTTTPPESDKVGDDKKPQTTDDDAKPQGYSANTNLEQISDWLTKIIVGVGLVQLTTLPGKLQHLATYFATAFGDQIVPSSVVMAVLGYFGIFGFLLGYLWARIYLMKEFSGG